MRWRSSYPVQDQRMLDKSGKMTDGNKIVTGCIKAAEKTPHEMTGREKLSQ